MAVTGRDREDMRRCDVGEGDLCIVGRNGEGDVCPVAHAALAVVLVPALVDRDLALVAALRQSRRLEGVDAVAVGILEPRTEAVGLPVAWAAELALEAARRDGDDGTDVVGDPMALVVVVELDVPAAAGIDRDVRATRLGMKAVVLVPGVVERRLVLEAAAGKAERSLPDVVGRVVREMCGRAVGDPVAAAAELALEAAGDRHARGGGRMRGEHGGRARRRDERRDQDRRPDSRAEASCEAERTELRGRRAHRPILREARNGWGDPSR